MTLTASEKKLVQLYRKADSNTKKAVVKVLDGTAGITDLLGVLASGKSDLLSGLADGKTDFLSELGSGKNDGLAGLLGNLLK